MSEKLIRVSMAIRDAVAEESQNKKILEDELNEKLNVSDTMFRKIFRILEQDGYLIRAYNDGFVYLYHPSDDFEPSLMTNKHTVSNQNEEDVVYIHAPSGTIHADSKTYLERFLDSLNVDFKYFNIFEWGQNTAGCVIVSNNIEKFEEHGVIVSNNNCVSFIIHGEGDKNE